MYEDDNVNISLKEILSDAGYTEEEIEKIIESYK